MKSLSFFCLILFLGSCAGGWTEDDKKRFRSDCMEQVRTQLPEDDGNKYCDCFTEQIVRTYPVFNDLIEKRDTAKIEAAKARCRKAIGLNY